jgi:membrane-bound lytic murein transglycosylase MltF
VFRSIRAWQTSEVIGFLIACATVLSYGADIGQIEANVHAGVKYMRFMVDRYFKDEPMDDLNKGLFTFASYNAGPGRVRQLRREAEKQGLNPNVWFGNVEQIASERIGRETVTYVANIYKYYIAYRLVTEEAERRTAAKATLKATQGK